MIYDRMLLNPLPDDEILDWSKLKQIADNILTLYSIDTHFDASMTAFENIVGKGEIAPTMFCTQSDKCIPICPYF